MPCPQGSGGACVSAPEVVLNEAKMQLCPGCAQSITKDGGCNHMSCTQCGTHWCWTCGDVVPLDGVTAHFKPPRTCSSFSYGRESETERIRSNVLKRADLSDEQKFAALDLLTHTHVQSNSDL